MTRSHRYRRRTWQIVVTALVVVHGALAARASSPDGRELYLRHCAQCHGATASGDGADAALFVPRPPNLRDGYLPAHPTADVVHRILDGANHLTLDIPAMRARVADTEALTIYLRQLPGVHNWPAVDAGQALFSERCAVCHGPFGSPGAERPAGTRPPRDLSDAAFQRDTSDVEMMTDVRHGRAGMPALTPRLGEADARNVVAFIRRLSPGYVTYTQYCAQCHGDHGIGVGSLAESIPAPTVIFDEAYFARHDGEALRASVWHMLDQHQPTMPHFRGAMTKAQATAIVRYLQRLPKAR